MTEKTAKILHVLDQMYPDAHVELHHKNAFELLVAVVLSAQTTDISVNKVTPELFSKYPNPKALAEADLKDLESILRFIGLYRNKAKHIKMLSAQLMDRHQGIVPSDRKAMEALTGVGRKTANVVLSNAFGIPALAVDTHVARVAVRLGLAKKNDSVLKIEEKLNRKIPKEKWQQVHHQFIFFGRYHCTARKPKCQDCPLYDLCVDPIKKK